MHFLVPGMNFAYITLLSACFTGAPLNTNHSRCWFYTFKGSEIYRETIFSRYDHFWETYVAFCVLFQQLFTFDPQLFTFAPCWCFDLDGSQWFANAGYQHCQRRLLWSTLWPRVAGSIPCRHPARRTYGLAAVLPTDLPGSQSSPQTNPQFRSREHASSRDLSGTSTGVNPTAARSSS